jgi:hypothetical protein
VIADRYEVHYKRPDGGTVMPSRWRLLANAEWEAEIAERCTPGMRTAIIDRENKDVVRIT